MTDNIETQTAQDQDLDLFLPETDLMDFSVMDIGNSLPNAYVPGRKRAGGTEEFYEDVYRLLEYRPAGEMDTIPGYVRGWDRVCLLISQQGKFAETLETKAKNAMNWMFISRDDESLDYINEMASTVMLRWKTINLFKNWLVFGRAFAEPVYSGNRLLKNRKLVKFEIVDPPSITVFFNTAADIEKLNEHREEFGIQDRAYISSLKPGSGTEIVAYVQYFNENVNVNPVFFYPDDLISFFRFPASNAKTGMSKVRENFHNGMGKLKLEHGEVVMGARYVDPTVKFYIPTNWWKKRFGLIAQIKDGIRRGMNIFMPVGMDAKALETQGTPEGVLKAQEHIETQVNAGYGHADSFTQSDSSNRSVGDIQLAFYEMNLEPERDYFADTLMQKIINPLLESNGFKKNAVTFKFNKLRPEDELQKQKIMVPLVPYMTQSMVVKFFTELGYQPNEKEIPELMEKLKSFVPPREDKEAAPKIKSGKGKAASDD